MENEDRSDWKEVPDERECHAVNCIVVGVANYALAVLVNTRVLRLLRNDPGLKPEIHQEAHEEAEAVEKHYHQEVLSFTSKRVVDSSSSHFFLLCEQP